MNKEELIGKLQIVYVGDKNAFNENVEIIEEDKNIKIIGVSNENNIS